MNRILSLILLVCIAATPAAAQLDQLASGVVYLFNDRIDTVVVDGMTFEIGLREPGSSSFVPRTVRDFGTGFLVASGPRLFLVTADHVTKSLTPDSMAVIRADLDTPRQVTLRQLTGWQGEIRWHRHPNTDLAITELRPDNAILPLLAGHFLPVEFLSPTPPSRDVTLTVLGFPLSLGSEGTFSPISRETHLAGGPVPSSLGPVLVLQDPSIGGYSGAPVFDLGLPVLKGGGLALRESKVLVVGVVSGTFSDQTGGKLGSMVASSAVLETLRQVGVAPN